MAGLDAVTLGLAFLTMEASFIFGGHLRHLPDAGVRRPTVASEWPGDDAGPPLLRILVGIGLPLIAVGVALLMFKVKLVGLVALGTASCWRCSW